MEPPDPRLGGPDRPARVAIRDCYAMLRRTTRHHRNAYFDLIRVLVEPPAGRKKILADLHLGCDPRLALRDEIRAIMNEWPAPCFDGGELGCPGQATPDPDHLLRLFPDRVARLDPLFPKAGEESLKAWTERTLAMALEPLPVDKRPGRRSDFIWQRDPITTGLWQDVTAEAAGSGLEIDTGNPEVTSPGIDYLLPYWMGCYLGVFQTETRTSPPPPYPTGPARVSTRAPASEELEETRIHPVTAWGERRHTVATHRGGGTRSSSAEPGIIPAESLARRAKSS